MISSDQRNNWHHCMAYTRLVESILILTVLALTIFVPATRAQVPESAFERRQDAILEKQSEKPSPPPPRAVTPPVVKKTVIREVPMRAPIAGQEITKVDLQKMNQNMEALKKSMDQLNETLKKLADALASQSKPQQ